MAALARCTPQLRRLFVSQRHSLASLRTVSSPVSIPTTKARLSPLHNSFSAAATAAPTKDASTGTTTTNNNKTKKNNDSNIFLDNLGKIFLGAIGLLIASLVRSSYGTKNRHKIRDALEESSALDPLEVDDLRVANSELTPSVFREILKHAMEDFPTNTATYEDFVKCVRRTMSHIKGEAFTVELGHLLDRAVFDAMKQQGKGQDESMPLVFFLAALSMALHSTVPDRIQILYEAMQQPKRGSSVTVQDVQEMVGYLQDTCQLVPGAQVVESPTKYPTQQYHRGTPVELVQWEGANTDVLDVDAFAAILRSRSVCAWGECYIKTKPN